MVPYYGPLDQNPRKPSTRRLQATYETGAHTCRISLELEHRPTAARTSMGSPSLPILGSGHDVALGTTTAADGDLLGALQCKRLRTVSHCSNKGIRARTRPWFSSHSNGGFLCGMRAKSWKTWHSTLERKNWACGKCHDKSPKFLILVIFPYMCSTCWRAEQRELF